MNLKLTKSVGTLLLGIWLIVTGLGKLCRSVIQPLMFYRLCLLSPPVS
jgi:hypothetical protein